MAWPSGLERPLVGAAVGMGLTIVLQSSSAMLGIVIAMASQGLLTLPAALAVMLGAEVGTCADTLLASIGRTTAAVRTGVFHLMFNLTTAGVGLMLLKPLGVAAAMFPGGDALPRQIANAHVLFNVAGVALFIGATPVIARLLERLVPERGSPQTGASTPAASVRKAASSTPSLH